MELGRRFAASLVGGVGVFCGGVASGQGSTTKTPLVMKAEAGKWANVMHGGAGVIQRSSMTPER